MAPALTLAVLLSSAALAAPHTHPRSWKAPRTAPGASDPSGARLEALAAELSRDRRSPRGIGLVAEIVALADEAPDLSRIAAILARTADDRAAHPEVRALARLRLAELEKSRGNPQRSAALVRRLGFVEAWRIAGPFDDEGKRGYEAVYPPERGIDLAAAMPGKVREVSPRADPVTGTFAVRVRLVDPPPAMRLGSTVTGRMTLDAAPAIEIPAAALVRSNGKTAVWIVDPAAKTVSLREIGVGASDASAVQVASGLAAGDIVVTAGVQALRPGQKVRLRYVMKDADLYSFKFN